MIRGNIAIPDRAEFDYIKRIKTLTEQRERLAEALERIANNKEEALKIFLDMNKSYKKIESIEEMV